jgi:hypothetical protein
MTHIFEKHVDQRGFLLELSPENLDHVSAGLNWKLEVKCDTNNVCSVTGSIGGSF